MMAIDLGVIADSSDKVTKPPRIVVVMSRWPVIGWPTVWNPSDVWNPVTNWDAAVRRKVWACWTCCCLIPNLVLGNAWYHDEILIQFLVDLQQNMGMLDQPWNLKSTPKIPQCPSKSGRIIGEGSAKSIRDMFNINLYIYMCMYILLLLSLSLSSSW